MQSQRFIKAKESTPPENRIFVENNLAFIDQLFDVMEEKGWSQKQLAQALGKSESEISKWTSGLHNLTFKTVAKLEAVLQSKLLITRKSYVGKYTAKCELHAQRMVKELRDRFQYSNIVVYHAKLDITGDGQHIAKRSERQVCYDKPQQPGIWSTAVVRRKTIKEKNGQVAA